VNVIDWFTDALVGPRAVVAVAAGVTTWLRLWSPVVGLLWKFEFEELYTAVIGWLPAVKNGAVQAAEKTPALLPTGATGQEISLALGRESPSVKVTVPAGPVPPLPAVNLMVAVSVTGWLTVEVPFVEDDVTVTEVAPAPTDWASVLAQADVVQLAKLVLPLV
jgi:hypothetical protein